MSCDHNTITDITLPAEKYILIYCGSDFIDAVFLKNKVTSAHTVEIFDTVQETIDRGVELGLVCGVGHLVTALEHGATLNQDCWNILNANVWEVGSPYRKRMEDKGYTKPE